MSYQINIRDENNNYIGISICSDLEYAKTYAKKLRENGMKAVVRKLGKGGVPAYVRKVRDEEHT